MIARPSVPHTPDLFPGTKGAVASLALQLTTLLAGLPPGRVMKFVQLHRPESRPECPAG
jgi:hypothetical protein